VKPGERCDRCRRIATGQKPADTAECGSAPGNIIAMPGVGFGARIIERRERVGHHSRSNQFQSVEALVELALFEKALHHAPDFGIDRSDGSIMQVNHQHPARRVRMGIYRKGADSLDLYISRWVRLYLSSHRNTVIPLSEFALVNTEETFGMGGTFERRSYPGSRGIGSGGRRFGCIREAACVGAEYDAVYGADELTASGVERGTTGCWPWPIPTTIRSSLFDVKDGANTRVAQVAVGTEPNGVAVSPDGSRSMWPIQSADGHGIVGESDHGVVGHDGGRDDSGGHGALWSGADAIGRYSLCSERPVE